MTDSVQVLQSYKYVPPRIGYTGPTKYMDLEIAPWNHITSLSREILANVKEWGVVGLQLNSPMGKGKTVFATVLTHHLACKGEIPFNVVWAEAEEFKHIEKFLESLPKYQPVVIIWDDITSALKEMPDKELHKNFNALTRIRHILDPEHGKTPAVVITTGHYSKNVEKEFRNVMEYVGFVSWTNEEHSNMDSIAPKKTQARRELLKFIKLYTKIASAPENEKFFDLRLGNGKLNTYQYSKPTRPACVVFGTEAKILHYSDKDVCQKCSKKKKIERKVPARVVFDTCIKHWKRGPAMKALKLHLWRKGIYSVFEPDVNKCSRYCEEKLFTEIVCDDEELRELLFHEAKKKLPKDQYRKRKIERQMSEELYDYTRQNKSINQSEIIE